VRSRAFTLLETMLALALVVLLSGAVFSFLLSLGERRKGFEGESRQRRAMMTVLSRMNGDLSSAIAGDPALGAGVSGSATSLRVLTRGVDLDAAIRGEARGESDLLACVYSFENGAITVSRRAVGAGGAPEAGPAPACDGVRRLRFRFYDGRGWADRFDSAGAGRLPRAVEVRVWQGAPVEGDESIGAPDETLVIAIPDSAEGPAR